MKLDSSEDECGSTPAHAQRKRIRAISSDSSDEENKQAKKTRISKRALEPDLEEVGAKRILRSKDNLREKGKVGKIKKIVRPNDSSDSAEDNDKDTPSKVKNKQNLTMLLKKKQEKRQKEIEDRYITSDDDEDNSDKESSSGESSKKKSKSKIKKNLEELRSKKKEGWKGKKILSSDEDEGGAFSNRHFKDADSDEDIDDFIDDDDLPMFKHEEFPPDSDEKASECEEVEEGTVNEESNESSSNGAPFANPYLERDKNMDKTDILDILSKHTEKDEKNKKKFKKEFGKYQFSIHSEHNKALYTSNKKRYENHMKYTKCDLGFKAERNLDRDDEDFFDSVKSNVLGTLVMIYPHTKRVTKYSSKCAISECGEKFTAGVTKVIGIKMEDDLGQFRKKVTISRETFFYMCASHCPDDEDISTDSYSDDD